MVQESTMSSRTAVEEWVIGACQQLGLPIETRDDDLFDTGAISLTVMRLIDRVEKEFGPDALSPEEVVERSSVHGIAAAIVDNIQDSALAAVEESGRKTPWRSVRTTD
jgi:acyl carrier protein